MSNGLWNMLPGPQSVRRTPDLPPLARREDNRSMSNPTTDQGAAYRFGECVLDTATRELYRGDDSVAIEPRVFDLLVYLIENRERTVSKAELLDTLWAGTVVTEASLTRCVMKARKAVGDDAGEGQIIRTVPRHGYRFVASLEQALARSAAEIAEDASAKIALERPSAPSVVVLPFSGHGGETTEMLADGLTEDIITDLSRNGWLFVIARNSSFSFKGQSLPSQQVARELGVRYIVEGSVRQAGDRLRVSAELVDADSGTQEWSHRYDRPVSDLFAVQDEITQGIVASLGSEIRRAESKRARRADPDSLDAWGLVHRGIAVSWSTFNNETNLEAEKLYRRAIGISPQDARAHAFLATSLAMKVTNGWSDAVHDERKEAWIEGQKALDLDPEDPMVLGQLGHLNTCLLHPEAALHLLDRSVELDPNNAFSIAIRAFALTAMKRAEEAVVAVEQAMRRSPRDPAVHWFLAMKSWAYLQLEQYRECADTARKSISAYSGWQPPWITLGLALAALGDFKEASYVVKQGRRIATRVPLFGFQDFLRYIARDDEQGEEHSILLERIWEEK